MIVTTNPPLSKLVSGARLVPPAQSTKSFWINCVIATAYLLYEVKNRQIRGKSEPLSNHYLTTIPPLTHITPISREHGAPSAY